MNALANALADEFARTNAEFIATVERCSPEDWRALCPDEGRPVGVLAHHVASSCAGTARLAQAAAAGRAGSVPVAASATALDERNAQHAARYAECSKEEVLGMLRANGAEAEGIVRAILDEHLGRTTPVGFLGDLPLSVRQIIEIILIGHPRSHLVSMRAVAAM